MIRSCRVDAVGYDRVGWAARRLARRFPASFDRESRAILAVAPSVDHVVGRWAIWRSNGVIVPIALDSPTPYIRSIIDDVRPDLIIVDQGRHRDRFEQIARSDRVPFVSIGDDRGADDDWRTAAAAAATTIEEEPMQHDPAQAAQIIYTSGTTGPPKGVVVTHGNLRAQVESLAAAWQITPADHLLHCLPLHHIHGMTNALECIVQSGGHVSFVDRFSAERVWERFCSDGTINVFMGVPTMYGRLVQTWQAMSVGDQQRCRRACSQFRLFVSGSSALPEIILDQWKHISGRTLLERYGMSETGMILSSPLNGPCKAGFVGKPLPGVQVKVVAEPSFGDGGWVEAGELYVKSDGVFSRYWNRPDHVSQGEFDRDGWFRTGDMVGLDGDGDYKVLGRRSTDILKTAGYKVSALEIEQCLLEHPDVIECAVVGVPNLQYGEIVSAVLVLRSGSDSSLSTRSVRNWVTERLPPYKVPRRYSIVESLPRNAMSKVNKKELILSLQTRITPNLSK